jgi:oligoribonuclease NrnB/cAMP/cGMP phosphodiesterase (DHH superfamily)
MNTNKTIGSKVLYHKNCVDGWVAALCAYKALGDSVDYVPINYHDPVPENVAFMLDFSSWPLPANCVVLDHHRSAIERGLESGLPGSLEDGIFEALDDGSLISINPHHSGAWLAWKYFGMEPELEELVFYAQDHDLWRFELPGSKEIREGFTLLPMNDVKEDYDEWVDVGTNRLAEWGRCILRHKEQYISKLVPSDGIVGGIKVKTVNSGYDVSATCHYILEECGCDVAVAWFKIDGGKVILSLRGKDVDKLARGYGGGGHPRAAGITLEGERASLWMNSLTLL